MYGKRLFVYSLLFYLVSVTMGVSAQPMPSHSFYKHLTGTLDTTMQLTVDLFSHNGDITGYYYYYFPEPGNEYILHYGKTIPIKGTITGSAIILNEFSGEGSSFKGFIDSENKISGTWERKEHEKSLPFKIQEDYSQGSLPFIYYSQTYQENLDIETSVPNYHPAAKINLILLYPDLQKGNPLKDTLDFFITQFSTNKKELISSPKLLLDNISSEFFKSYFAATEGIEDISSSASLNWEKNLSMDIRHNENNIVSIKFEKYAYTGGAHGISMTEYAVCDLTKKEKLSLKDIFKENAKDEIDNILDLKLRKLNGLNSEESLREAGFFVDKMEWSENFFINNQGIGFFYNVYEIAPYASGTTELFIPFTEITEFLKPNHPFNWIKKHENSVKL
ncbi:MAG: DUF3298 and DUF4163 domain-containing protein [Bacteroidales bacterium]|nr:DUF3298 and DUF4163 domain-containing protein [Bacteroidales bacterium]